ncbi:telomerase Cajal body protein 1 [Microplitis demolitor]|uniref:telomerase Cajal body protein 1 n=1 Tax=Microplitis demolitor TaxID=69319 RepID=UPI0004CCAA65|nr:telomerase Cajal body protein 1 [Microplitis demolitor]
MSCHLKSTDDVLNVNKNILAYNDLESYDNNDDLLDLQSKVFNINEINVSDELQSAEPQLLPEENKLQSTIELLELFKDNSKVSDESQVEKKNVHIADTKLSQENHSIVPETLDSDTITETLNYYDWSKPLRLLCTVAEEPPTDLENLTRGCIWSPDGTCLLVPSADFRIRVYELPRELYTGTLPGTLPLPPLTPALKIKEGGLVYDTCWYPWMSSWEPDTCCFLSTSKETPVHLWDAFTGSLRATYRAYNQVDEVEAAISVQFAESGSSIWTGFDNALRSFDTNRPGRQINDVLLKNDFPNVRGIVSCIRDNPTMPGLIAFGTYSKCIGLYKDGPLCVLKTDSGVTQIEFSACGTKLYSAVRRSNEFICWDLRNPGIILKSFEKRQADTNQRIQFCVSNDGNQIISGSTDGEVKVWSLENSTETEISPSWSIKLSNDCINGVNTHKTLPILSTCSGQRFHDNDICKDNNVRFWYCSPDDTA